MLVHYRPAHKDAHLADGPVKHVAVQRLGHSIPILLRLTDIQRDRHNAAAAHLHLFLSQRVGESVDVYTQQLGTVSEGLGRFGGYFGGLAVLALLKCDVACSVERNGTINNG